MENEIDRASNLGVSLIALAAILVIVMATVGIGTSLKNQSLEEFDDIGRQAEINALVELNGGKTDMPIASAYQIMKSCEGSIDAVYYYNSIYSGMRDKVEKVIDEVGNNLRGRCELEVEKQTDGGYNVKVHLDTCTDACTCFNN